MEIRSDSSVAVIGAGTMGCGIAQVAGAAGHAVLVIDSNSPALERGQASLAKSLASLVKRGRIDQDGADAIAGRVRWTTDIGDAAGCTLAIEAIVERLDAKQQLFGALAATLGEGAILASNTSSLSIAAMADGLARPERFLGLHFFNPVPAMKLVEIVAGPDTAEPEIAAMHDLMRRWGKHPVSVRDVPGFIVNRVARPYYAEAFIALDEGIAPEVIDAALTQGGGFRMGPLTLADMIGHDINFTAASSVHACMTPHVRFRPQPAQARLVEQQWLGHKSGRGVYDYGADLPAAAVLRSASSTAIALPAYSAALAPLAALLSTPVDATLAAGTLRVDDVRIAMGDGRPLVERGDVDAILDHALDMETAPILVATVRNAAARDAVAALAGTLDKAVLILPDRPGQIALRTWLQLANGAADAVADAVADAGAINEAMLYGANYPVGPIQWVRRFGIDPARQALARIAAATGDDLYAPSKGFAGL